jgi:hypothetical protein
VQGFSTYKKKKEKNTSLIGNKVCACLSGINWEKDYTKVTIVRSNLKAVGEECLPLFSVSWQNVKKCVFILKLS